MNILKLPDCDIDGVPVSKMPNCPFCHEDELGMMESEHAICYNCSEEFFDILDPCRIDQSAAVFGYHWRLIDWWRSFILEKNFGLNIEGERKRIGNEGCFYGHKVHLRHNINLMSSN